MSKAKKSKRNWPQYNEHVVQRGEILLSLETLKGWQKELEEMNLRTAAPSATPPPPDLAAFWAPCGWSSPLPYRQLERLARGLKKVVGLPAPDYSTLSLWVPKLDLDLGYEPLFEPIVITVDATGIKVTNRSEWIWMRKKRRGYAKLHVAVDTTAKQALSLEVSEDQTHSPWCGRPKRRQS